MIKITVAFYLGIDSGGSKTTCSVGDETSLVATATAGPSNVVRVGGAQARESLHQSVRQACAAAGITPAQVARTCIGAAGAVRAEIISIVRAALAEILPTAIDVVGDMEIALDAAFHDGPGVIISAVLRAKDSAEVSPASKEEVAPLLLAALLKAWGMASLDDFLRAANSIPPPDFAVLFPALVAAVQVNDELARQILTQAGRELAHLAAIVIRRLQARATPLSDIPESRLSESLVAETPVRLAIAGGVFRHAHLVRDVFYNEVRRLHPLVEINPQIVEPVEGALRLARRAVPRSVVNDCEKDINRKAR